MEIRLADSKDKQKIIKYDNHIHHSGTCLSVLSGQLNHITGRPYSLFFFSYLSHIIVTPTFTCAFPND